MRPYLWLLLYGLVLLPGLAQQPAPASSTPALPKDPRAVFDLARPLYDFSDPSLKPWHLKASYQLYDEKGAPATKGTFEYWWASPKLLRLRWSRPDAEYNEWHTPDGKVAYRTTGERLRFYEYKIQSALLDVLPSSKDLDPDQYWFKREEVKASRDASVKNPCFEVIPHMGQPGKIPDVPLGLFPTYCFDTTRPLLLFQTSFGNLAVHYRSLVKTQGHVLAKEVEFSQRQNRVLSVQVEQIEPLAPTDAALTPSPEAHVTQDKRVLLSPGVVNGMLIEKTVPIYPIDAKEARIAGTVVLKAIIGRDGHVHDLRVISAPWPSLAASALQCVSQWRYKPYMLNDDPVEVETTVNVIYVMNF